MKGDVAVIELAGTYLRLSWCGVIVTIWCCAQGSSWSRSKVGSKTSALCEVLIALGLANLDLLLLTTATELLWLESTLGLELGAAMLWDVTLRHGCGLCVCKGFKVCSLLVDLF